MAELSDLSGTIVMVGREKELRKVFSDLRNPARNKVNKRTGNAYTVYKEPQYTDGRNSKGTRRRKMTLDFSRPQLINNTLLNFEDHVQRAINRINPDDIEVKIDVDQVQN